MEWSFKIATIHKVPIRVHITLIFVLAWVWLAYFQKSGMNSAWEAVGFIVAVFACIVAHELGHTLIAQFYGINVDSITLYPIGGAASLTRETHVPKEELLIAAAGPLVNLVIFTILFGLFHLGNLELLGGTTSQMSGFMLKLASANLFLAVFNLIPAFPMDGARILRAVLSHWLDNITATRTTATIGQGIAIILGFVGLFTDPLLMVIALLIFLSASSEARQADLIDISQKVNVRDVMITEFKTFTRSTNLQHAVDRLLATTQSEFPVVDGDGRLTGLVTRADIVSGLKMQGPETSCGQVMRTEVPYANDRTPLAETLKRLQAAKVSAIVILNDAGEPIGLINYENIGEMLMVRDAVDGSGFFARLHG